MKLYFLLAVSVFGGQTVTIPADPKTPETRFGAPSPEAAPALARLTYLVGDWTVTSFERTSSGTFVASPAVSFLRARYLRDGLSLMAEFYEERPDGFHGFHIVTHDPERGLVHRYFDARRNQRIEFVGAFRGGEYDITRRGGYDGRGEFLYKETDSEITATSFVKRIYQSGDEGKTWKQGDYYFRYTRVR